MEGYGKFMQDPRKYWVLIAFVVAGFLCVFFLTQQQQIYL